MCNNASEPIAMAYFVNPSFQFLWRYVHPPIIARQQLGKIVNAATNTRVTTELFLDASFFIQSTLYERKVGNSFFPKILVSQLPIEQTTTNRRF
jgi:hypothetical protein